MNQKLQFENRYILIAIWLWKKFSSKELKFIDVVVICLTTISLMVLHWTTTDNIWLLLWRWALMLPIMYITALVSHNYESYNEQFNYAYEIIMCDLSIEKKYDALKNHIGTITSAWDKYWKEFQAIVNGGTDPIKKTEKVLKLIHRVTKGGITLPKIIYISIYGFYSIIICSNLFQISDPYDIMINFVFITILRYWGSDMKGLFNLLSDFFDVLKPESTNLQREQGFIELGKKIEDGCYAAFILTSNNPLPLSCPLEGKVKDIDGMKVKVNGSKFTEKEMDLIVTKEISDGLKDASKEMDAKKIELIKEINAENAEKKE